MHFLYFQLSYTCAVITNVWKQSPFDVNRLSGRLTYSLHFMDPEVLLLCLQQPNISSCSDQINLVHSIPSYFLSFILIYRPIIWYTCMFSVLEHHQIFAKEILILSVVVPIVVLMYNYYFIYDFKNCSL